MKPEIQKFVAEGYDWNNIDCYVISSESDLENLKTVYPSAEIGIHIVEKARGSGYCRLIWEAIRTLPDARKACSSALRELIAADPQVYSYDMGAICIRNILLEGLPEDVRTIVNNRILSLEDTTIAPDYVTEAGYYKGKQLLVTHDQLHGHRVYRCLDDEYTYFICATVKEGSEL